MADDAWIEHAQQVKVCWKAPAVPINDLSHRFLWLRQMSCNQQRWKCLLHEAWCGRWGRANVMVPGLHMPLGLLISPCVLVSSPWLAISCFCIYGDAMGNILICSDEVVRVSCYNNHGSASQRFSVSDPCSTVLHVPNSFLTQSVRLMMFLMFPRCVTKHRTQRNQTNCTSADLNYLPVHHAHTWPEF
jgi:hypothetical protein